MPPARPAQQRDWIVALQLISAISAAQGKTSLTGHYSPQSAICAKDYGL
jgi:hypothetical protein